MTTLLPTRERMYAALTARDPAFEGIFFTAVKTTHIFCRPTCRAKTPRLENVDFFPCATDALAAGYRPCLRCRPTELAPRPPALVARLREAVEHAPGGRLTDKELLALEIEPTTARRQFRRYYGVTFHAWQRARRLGLALGDVRAGRPLAEAGAERGYGSASAFRDAFSKTFGQPPGQARKAVQGDTASGGCLFESRYETPLGSMIALADERGLRLLEFADRRGLPREVENLRRRLRAAVVPGTNAHLQAIGRELAEYFAGRRQKFTVPLAPVGSDFQLRVWDQLCAIPHGETRAYAHIAAAIGQPRAVRAIGRTNGSNMLCLVIPCHRVIRADGALCGYGGGVWRKRWLIDHERGMIGQGNLALDQPRTA